MPASVDALVIGAGVSGLTTAVTLAEAGLAVRIVSAEPPAETTSAAAGAMWGPYLVEPRDRVHGWSMRSLKVFRDLAGQIGTGVCLVSGVEASRRQTEPPSWASALPGHASCGIRDLPPGFASGWRSTVPVIDMPVYLNYLTGRLTAAGGGLEIRRLTSLNAGMAQARVVVNCSGMGARELAADPDLAPIRGQVVVVENPGITEFFSEDTGQSPELTHIYPMGRTAVLGGTAEIGRSDRLPDREAAEGIVRRCAEIEPGLLGAAVVAHRVGLRPTRPSIRVETAATDRRLIHNYGHGGAGVTLSWGCAAEVAALLPRLP